MEKHRTFPIIEKLGGRRAVSRLLTRPHETRKAVTLTAIGLWVHRGRIPGWAVVDLLAIAQARGITLGPDDFKRRGKSKTGMKEAAE